jgi:hypothetical protein
MTFLQAFRVSHNISATVALPYHHAITPPARSQGSPVGLNSTSTDLEHDAVEKK